MKALLKRLIDAFEERTGLLQFFGSLARHPVPPGTGWSYVFGSAVFTAFLIQVITGIALATRYVSAAGSAYDALRFITNQAFFGSFVRGMHFFGASAMILLVGAHMAQVFLFGAYKYPRELNWITGVCLLGMVVAMGFTGQLLRWDQTAVWAVQLAAEMAGRVPILGKAAARFLLGGSTLGGATLSRFFAFHVFFIPAAIFLFIGVHLYLVFHDGISERPVPGEKVDPITYRERYERMLEERGVPFWPDAAWRDAVFAFLVVVAIALLAYFVGAPKLDNPPDPSLLAKDPQPDWYMLWFYAMLALIPHGLTPWFLVLAPLLAFAVLVIVPPYFNYGERHPSRRPWAVAATIVVVMMIGTLWVEGRRHPWSPDFGAQPLPPSITAGAPSSVVHGAQLFHERGCEFCHQVAGYGGERGPDLSDVGARLTREQLVIRILNGGYNMPGFASTLTPAELDDLVAFLLSRVPGAYSQETEH